MLQRIVVETGNKVIVKSRFYYHRRNLKKRFGVLSGMLREFFESID
jgi:hypothetical protein